MTPSKMMYNMSMLRHPFSNERWCVGGGGGGGALNHLPLLFCKSVCKLSSWSSFSSRLDAIFLYGSNIFNAKKCFKLVKNIVI